MRKAQITMESLLLYGAAILVVLLALAALTYFGVLDMGRYLPDKCNVESTGIFTCEEWRVSDGQVQVAVRNKASKAMEISAAMFRTESANCTFSPGTPVTVHPGKSEAITITSCEDTYAGLGEGDKVKGTLKLTHKPVGGKIDTVTTGELQARIS